MRERTVKEPYFYRPDAPKVAIDVLSKGGSLCAVAAELDVCVETVGRWRETVPDFGEAIKKGLAKSQAHWEKLGMDWLVTHATKDGTSSINYNIYQMHMRNRFGWRCKDPDVVNVNMTDTRNPEIEKAAEEAYKQRKKKNAADE